MNSKENKEEKISSNIEKYNTIMESYRNKKFSKSHLTMNQILEMADETNLFSEMSLEEIDDLLIHSSGITKAMFLNLRDTKLHKENKQKSSELTLKKRVGKVIEILSFFYGKNEIE